VEDGFLHEAPSKVSRLSVSNGASMSSVVTTAVTKTVPKKQPLPEATLDTFVFPNPKMPQTVVLNTKGKVEADVTP